MAYGYRGLETKFVGGGSGGWRKPKEEGDYLLTIDEFGKSGWRKTENGGSGDLELGDTSSTAYRGDHGLTAYEHVSDTDNPHLVSPDQIGAAKTGGDQLVQFSVANATEDNHAVNKKQLEDVICEIDIDGGTFN
jgi:hypothetical protein